MTVVCLVQDESDLLCGSGPEPGAREAPASVARWAAEFARRLGRDLVLLHAPAARGAADAKRKTAEAPGSDAALEEASGSDAPRAGEPIELTLAAPPESADDPFLAALHGFAAKWTSEDGAFRFAAEQGEPTDEAPASEGAPTEPARAALRPR